MAPAADADIGAQVAPASGGGTARREPLRVVAHGPSLIAHEARARRGARTARILCAGLPVAIAAMIAVATAGTMLGAWRFAVIDSGSMRPALDPGDVAVLTAEPIGDVRRGQVVAFHPPGESFTVTHRVYSIEHTPAGLVIQTKGDANNAVDQWRASLTGRTVFHETMRLPKLGYLVVFAEQRVVRFLFLLAMVAIAAMTALSSIWRPAPRRRAGIRGRASEVRGEGARAAGAP
jgi:signal peptidase